MPQPAAPPTATVTMVCAALDLLATGIVVLDRTLRVAHANAAARPWLRDGPLRLDQDRLAIGRPSLRLALLAAIAQALGAAPPAQRRVAVLRLAPEPDAPQLLVAALTPDWAGLFLPARAGDRAAPINVIQAAFGFSRAQAVVAELATRGLSQKEIATELNVSPHTVRAHLRALFDRAGVRRQADLTRLVVQRAGLLRA